MTLGSVLVVASLLVMAPASQSASREPAAVEQVQQGAILFSAHCSVCHGEEMKAQPGMKDLRAFTGGEDVFRTTVATGNGIMPSFEGVFTPNELDALYAYVRSGGSAGNGEK